MLAIRALILLPTVLMAQPIRNVTKEYPPTLLLHGDKDTDVPYEQSVLMARKLDEYHVEHDMITMPNRGHGFDREMQDPAVSAAFDRVMVFLKKHLQPN